MRRSPLRRVSKKRQAMLKEYGPLRRKFLQDHSECACCHEAPATQIHHRGKPGQMKRGSNTNNTETWLAVCAPCHDRIERNKGWARENGYLST